MKTNMDPTRPNDFAFPEYQADPCHPGLTKREFFAATAMQGLLACPVSQLGPQGEIPSNAAQAAVRYADALIRALNEPTETEPKTEVQP